MTTGARHRFDRLDALRALAMVWMAIYHFAFDLNHFGLLEPRHNFYHDALWTTQRTVIVSLFLFCAGFGQAIAIDAAQTWPRFWRRWLWVAGCALAVSIGSSFMFPNSWIGFGVLHGIAVMLIVVRLTGHWGWMLWPLGLVAVLLPRLVADPFFDQPLTHWVGLVTRKPITEDWVPVLPWLGVMWWGCAAGQWTLTHRRRWVAGPLTGPLASFAGLGRWSLSFYMVHQPVLIGLILGWRQLMG